MSGENARELGQQAIKLFLEKEYESSLESFVRASTINCSDPIPYFNLSLALAKLGDLENALLFIEKGLEIDPYDRKALKLLAILFHIYKKQNPGEASMAEIRWIARYLDKKDFFMNYLEMYEAKSDYSHLLTDHAPLNYNVKMWDSKNQVGIVAERVHLEEMNVKVPDIYRQPTISSWGYRFLGLVEMTSFTNAELIEYLGKSYENLPESEKIIALIWIFNLGKKLYENADYKEASEILEFIATLEPSNIAVLIQCGNALRDSGEIELIKESLKYYKQIINEFYDHSLAWQQMAYSYAMLGDFQKELYCLIKTREIGNISIDHGRIAYLERIAYPVNPFD
ncbi:MAG: hypothetical protein ACTSUE_10435 [Promethearchaeota archaeon]